MRGGEVANGVQGSVKSRRFDELRFRVWRGGGGHRLPRATPWRNLFYWLQGLLELVVRLRRVTS